MASETPAARESQEQSIKARKHELFEEEAKGAPVAPRRPIQEYLDKTPATPLAPFVKTALWVAGVLVVLLFLGALYSVGARPKRRPARHRAAQAAPHREDLPDRSCRRRAGVLG